MARTSSIWRRIDIRRRRAPSAWRYQQQVLEGLRNGYPISTTAQSLTPTELMSRRSSVASSAGSNVGGILAAYNAGALAFPLRHGRMSRMRLLPGTRAFRMDFRRRHRRRNRRLFRRSRR